MRPGGFNPASALFGPIFQKEVRSAGRRRSTYILRFLYTVGLLVLVGIAFWGARTSGVQKTAVQYMQELQRLAPAMTMVAMWFQFVALALIAPMLAAPVISDERRARSLSTLLTTPLRASEIILGKTASRLVQVVILALLAAPVLLAIRVFGGLEPAVVFAYTCVSLSVAVLGASLGVLFSIWHRRAASAALFALLSLVLVQCAPTAVEGILYYILNDYGSTTHYEFHEQVAATAAPYALAGLSEVLITGGTIPVLTIESRLLYNLFAESPFPPGTNAVAPVPIAPVWVVNCIYNLLASAGITGLSIIALRRTMRRDGGESKPAARARRRKKRAKAAQAAAADPVLPAETHEDGEITERRASRTVSDAPVLWRELRRASIGSRLLRRSIIALSVGGLLLLYITVGIDDYGLQMTMAILASLIVMVQAVFMTTGSVAAEREGRTWEVLLTTPLTGREVVLGKFLGALRSQWFLPAVAMTHFVLAALFDVVPWYFLLQFGLILAGPLVFLTATGQYLSLAFRKGIVGAVLNLMIGMGLWIGLWIVLGLIGWFGDIIDSDYWENLQKVPYALNPVLMAGSACEAVTDFRSPNLRAVRYQMMDAEVRFDEFMGWLVGVFLFYMLAGAGVLWLAVVSFRRLSGRSS